MQSKHRDATPSITTSSASAVHQLDCCSRSTVVSAVDASTDPSPAPSKPLFAPSDAPAFEHSLTNPSNSSEVSGLPSSPIPRHYADTSIFNSPLTSPAASSAGDTTLLSAQVVDLRRRLAECERDKDARSREYDMIIQQALDAAAAVRLELQEVRDRSFEDSESLHFQHQQALGSLNSENLRLQQTIDSSQAMKEVIAERLHAIEAELVDTTSRLEAAQCKLSEQTALCLLAQARQEELQLVITTQMQEISTLGSRHSSSLIAFQQRECDLQDKIQADGIAHKEEVNGMRSQIATLSTELQHHKSALSSLHQEIEISRSTYNAKSNDDSNAASTEVAKLRLLMQESSDNAAVLISKLQSDFNTKEQELVASQAAVTESNRRESSLQQQVELLLSQLSQKNQNAQEQKAVLSSPAFASPGDSTALEVSTRRVAEIERKYCIAAYSVSSFVSFF